MSSIRGKHCYLCGEPLPTHQDADEELLDRKLRRVHRDCKLARQKALQDLWGASWSVKRD